MKPISFNLKTGYFKNGELKAPATKRIEFGGYHLCQDMKWRRKHDHKGGVFSQEAVEALLNRWKDIDGANKVRIIDNRVEYNQKINELIKKELI